MRYTRQIPVFGDDGQGRIQSSIVGVAGCGGLGVNAVTQLAMAGVGGFVLSDPDFPDITNMNRQFIYSPGDCRPKARITAEWVLALNPVAEVEAHAEPVTPGSKGMFEPCDVILDCLDNMESRMALSDISEELDIPLVHAGVTGLHGQIAVCIPGKTPSLRDMIGHVKDEDTKVAVGAAVSAIASMQALEALKIVSRIGSDNEGTLITVDMDTWKTVSVRFGER